MFNVSGKGKGGFTLAEVLITLSIIGVVAALTIPTLARKYEKQLWITQYKETYNIVSQATKMVATNNRGSLKGAWEHYFTETMYNAYLPYLKTSVKCKGVDIREKCMSLKGRLLDGTEFTNPPVPGYAVVLVNGASLQFNTAGEFYTFITIDTNGLKGPNVNGKDLHTLQINFTTNSITPNIPPDSTPSEDEILENCTDNLSSGRGDYCGIRILRGDYGTAY